MFDRLIVEQCLTFPPLFIRQLFLFFPPIILYWHFLCAGTAHCANMYPARSEDLLQLVRARDHIFLLLQQWLKQWVTDWSGCFMAEWIRPFLVHWQQMEAFQFTATFMTALYSGIIQVWKLKSFLAWGKGFICYYESHFFPSLCFIHYSDFKMLNSCTFLVKVQTSFFDCHYFLLSHTKS